MKTDEKTLSVVAEIGAERSRQIHKKGYVYEHDDKHADGSIAMAAAHYASTEPVYVLRRRTGHYSPDADPYYSLKAYPWDLEFDSKREHTRREQLVIAGALIVAEIERIDRAAPSATKEGEGE